MSHGRAFFWGHISTYKWVDDMNAQKMCSMKLFGMMHGMPGEFFEGFLESNRTIEFDP